MHTIHIMHAHHAYYACILGTHTTHIMHAQYAYHACTNHVIILGAELIINDRMYGDRIM